jgi:hypothetical protein
MAPKYRKLVIMLILSFAISLALAESEQATEKEEEPFPIETATCADIYGLFEEASPAEGKDPEELKEAQDEVLYFVTWVHGFLSGRDGIDQERRPMSKSGIVTTIEEMAKVCDPDESRLFMEAVKDIK